MNFGNHIIEIPAAQTCWLKTNCGNAIAENGRKKKIMVVEIWRGIKKKMLHLQYFYNIFTTNHRWLVIISSNLNLRSEERRVGKEC